MIAVPETRQLDVLANLLEKRGARVLRCPLVAIKDASDPTPVLAWIERFIAMPPDLFVLYTGEGLERLLGFAEQAGRRDAFVAALTQTPRKLCRGPKPKRALKRLGLQAELDAAAPTTAGIIATLEQLDLAGRRLAIQLYGDQRIPELDAFLDAGGIRADFVAPYVYASEADDTGVAELIARLVNGEVHAVAFTSQSQVERLFKVAAARHLDRDLEQGLKGTCIAAVGPVVAGALQDRGVAVDVMPDENFFMKPLVTALADRLLSQSH